VELFGKYYAQVGLTSGEAKKNKIEFIEYLAKARNLVEAMPGSDYVFGKILAEKKSKKVIGASFLGGREISGYADLISVLIKLRTDVFVLSKINYNYTPPLSPFINLLKVIGKNINL
jgi:pyruvate/2-oxoglutarate dehydrogenase complex dihydrolipoamide dehydrogenase (E3) component